MRYALYFAPAPASSWWRFGSDWLGRDAASGAIVPQPVPAGIDADRFARLTAAPRHYGFHATLKAPMRLVEGVDRAALVAALRAFCADEQPFALPPLGVGQLDDFLALVPLGDAGAIHALAARTVERFDRFRAPLTQAELARRLQKPLPARERDYLARWGYPLVFDAYRFHMSLTGSLCGEPDATIQAIRIAAERARPAQVLRVDAIALFEQPGVDVPFRLVERYRFGQQRDEGP